MTVQVWGSGALFTRPELKVERVTYPVITPSAAVGVLEAIFWKPEFDWHIVAVEVLHEIRQFTQRRNETTDLASLADAASGTRRINTAAHRVQRNAVCLKDVAYRIHAHVQLRSHATKSEAAYRDQFRRRVNRGSCFSQPYLGTREFSAFFSEPDASIPHLAQPGLGHHAPLGGSLDHTTNLQLVHRPARPGSATRPGRGNPDVGDVVMLLQRLRDYTRENLNSPPFHRERGFSWRLDLDRDGRLRSPQLGVLSQDDAKGRPGPVRHLVPTAVRTVGVAANLAADDIQYVLGWPDESSKPERVAGCHTAFVDLVQRWAASEHGRNDPVAQAVAAFYRDDGLSGVSCEGPFGAKDGVLIVVDGQPAYQAQSVALFWSEEVARRKGSDRIGLCLVCGTVQPLLDTVPGKIPARLVPGASNDAALVSINERVFGYDLTTQLGSSPLCQSCAEDVTAGLIAVLDSRHATGYDGDSRLAWWLPHQGDDHVVRLLFEPTPEDVADLIASIHDGRRRVSTTDGEFCSLSVGGNVARVMVRDWVEMPLAQVEHNVAEWFADHAIASVWGRNRTHSIGQLVWATGRRTSTNQYVPFGAKAAHRPHGAYRALVGAAIRKTPLSPDLLVHVVNRVRTDGHLDDLRAALLRLALVRSPSLREKPMPDLDVTNHDPAYVAGRLFAAYESVQYAAYGKELNTTYRDRYFAGALNNPRAALINGERNATAWLKKLRRDNKARHHEQRLDDLTRLLDAHNPIPARMTPQDQALFLVGYHHQRAHQIAAATAARATKEDPAS